MNWRKIIIYALFYSSGSKIPRYLEEINNLENSSIEKIRDYQSRKLKKLLFYSWENVPYYRRILEEVGVVKNGKVILNNFCKIPILTKNIDRKSVV